MTEPLFFVRGGTSSDHQFVLASWVESDRHSPAARDVIDVHRQEHRALAERLVFSHSLTVAHAPGDPDAILGWALTGDSGEVYYVYVKRDARRLGIARALLGDLVSRPCVYTHRPVVRGITLPEGWTYNPYRNWR